MSYQPRLKKEFNERIVSSLKKEYSYKNVMMVPKLMKIVISKGVGAAVSDKKLIDHAIEELTMISGQKAIATISKKDVASFKLRKGMPIGAKVTLRSERMYEFLDRLITSALPRVRDFQGIKSSGFDGRGNYNLGVTEQIIFPEIDIDKVNKISGMDISFVTSANTDKEAQSLLSELGLPFKKNTNFNTNPQVSGEINIENAPVVEEAIASEANEVVEPKEDIQVVEEAVVEEAVVSEANEVVESKEDTQVVEEAVVSEANEVVESKEDTQVVEEAIASEANEVVESKEDNQIDVDEDVNNKKEKE